MVLDPQLMPLCDALVELVVADVLRELEKETPSAFGGQHDGVGETSSEQYTSVPTTAETVRVVSHPV